MVVVLAAGSFNPFILQKKKTQFAALSFHLFRLRSRGTNLPSQVSLISVEIWNDFMLHLSIKLPVGMLDLSLSRAGFDLPSHDTFGTATLILTVSLQTATSRKNYCVALLLLRRFISWLANKACKFVPGLHTYIKLISGLCDIFPFCSYLRRSKQYCLSFSHMCYKISDIIFGY